MDLRTLEIRTGIPSRKLRYVLDQRLLPGLRIKQEVHEAGRPRTFTDFEGFGVACAASLLEAGLKGEVVLQFLTGLAEISFDRTETEKTGNFRPMSAFLDAFSSRKSASAELGHGINIRVRCGKQDTGWIEPRSKQRLQSDYTPLATTFLDLGLIRNLILGR